MLGPKGCVEAVLRNEVATVPAALRPGAMVGVPVVVALVSQGRVALPSAMSSPASLLLPRSSLFLRTLGRRLLITLRLLSLGLGRRLLTTLLHRPLIVALVLLRSPLNGLLRHLRVLLRLSLLRRPGGLHRHLRTLLPLRFWTSLLLRLNRLRLWWWLWLLRRLRPRISLLWWQALLIPVWFSLLLLLRSLLSGPRLFPVRLLLMLRLRCLLRAAFFFVFFVLTERHTRSAKG